MTHSPSRRTLLAGAAGLSALATLDALTNSVLAASGTPAKRMPVIFIGHGSPMNAIQDNAFTRELKAWGMRLPRPKAILSVSAHWQTPGETKVDVQAKPKTIHDFGGFPRELHEMQYPAPGAPAVAQEVARVLEAYKAQTATDWGLDHGTWTVLHHLFPKADIPVFQLSIDYAREGAFHYEIGQRLAKLREKGVLILGSGNIVHNLRATVRGAPESQFAATGWAQDFDDKVKFALQARDDKALMAYTSLDAGARMAVPTPDHYWPFLYALGAADPKDEAKTTYASFQSGTLSMRCLQFG